MANRGSSLAEEWASFEEQCVSKDASELQKREMRWAFYAGAKSTFGLMEIISETANELDAVRRIKALNGELTTWAAEINAIAAMEKKDGPKG